MEDQKFDLDKYNASIEEFIKAFEQAVTLDTDIPHKVGFAFDKYMLLHEHYGKMVDGGYHVERPTRLMSIYINLEKKALLRELAHVHCPLASKEKI